jgi:hypothetical protein
MSSKQKHAVKGKVQKVPQNQGWTALSWDDLTEWAGPRSVERGRAYQKQGRVHDLAISEDGWLLATVTGGERYAVTVWCEQSAKKGGALYSRCTCPVGASGCKHAVAAVAEYLEMLGEDAEAPVADQDDERWERRAPLLRPSPLAVSMSRSRLFLGGLHSCIARFRFAGRIHLRACRLRL